VIVGIRTRNAQPEDCLASDEFNEHRALAHVDTLEDFAERLLKKSAALHKE